MALKSRHTRNRGRSFRTNSVGLQDSTNETADTKDRKNTICIVLILGACSPRWNTEACATLFVRGSNGIRGQSPFILTALSQLRTDSTERAQMQNSAFVP